jgi:hypothetical protein
MIPVERISRYWYIDTENTGLMNWNDYDAPEEFCLHCVSKRHQDYCISIEISLHNWRVGLITLWHNEGGVLRPVTHTKPDVPNLEDLLLDWAHHPQKYDKKEDSVMKSILLIDKWRKGLEGQASRLKLRATDLVQEGQHRVVCRFNGTELDDDEFCALDEKEQIACLEQLSRAIEHKMGLVLDDYNTIVDQLKHLVGIHK